jgi:hypothetical protein
MRKRFYHRLGEKKGVRREEIEEKGTREGREREREREGTRRGREREGKTEKREEGTKIQSLCNSISPSLLDLLHFV